MEKIVELKQKSTKKKLYKWTFIADLKAEFRKITWTQKDELFQSTKVVVASIFIFGFGIYVVDLVVRGGLNWLDFAAHKIFG